MDQYVCKFCDKVYEGRNNMIRHIQVMHDSKAKKWHDYHADMIKHIMPMSLRMARKTIKGSLLNSRQNTVIVLNKILKSRGLRAS